MGEHIGANYENRSRLDPPKLLPPAPIELTDDALQLRHVAHWVAPTHAVAVGDASTSRPARECLEVPLTTPVHFAQAAEERFAFTRRALQE
jgi:hypothetical protein